MVRKKEDPEKVKARVMRYLENKQQLLITGLSEDEKNLFINIPGLENLSHGKKLLSLIEFWNKNQVKAHEKEIKPRTVLGVPVKNDDIFQLFTSIVKESIPDDKTEKKQPDSKSDISILIDKLLLTGKPSYNTPQNKLYWKERIKNDDLNKAFDELNKINHRIKYLVINNYISITEKEVIELASLSEKKRLKVLKETLELTDYSKAKSKTKPEPEKQSLKIENWNKFITDFNDFLFNYKSANRTRARLRTHGQTIRDDMENHPEYKEAFNKICGRLPEDILKNFKPMFRQGYFYLYENEIIEIAKTEAREELMLLLLESLRHTNKDEPVKEAKKKLGLV